MKSSPLEIFKFKKHITADDHTFSVNFYNLKNIYNVFFRNALSDNLLFL